jgi:cysteine desulfurase
VTVYLDHAASAPLRSQARDAWLAASDVIGNPSSVHAAGQAARRVLEDARERLAAVLDCDPIEVVFTSGGTESVNLGLAGLWRAHASRSSSTVAIVVPDGEHHATVETVQWLVEHENASVRAVPLDADGTVDLVGWSAALASAAGTGPASAVATMLAANNEVGTIQPVEEAVAIAATSGVPMHLDAVGAVGWMALSFRALRAGARPAGAGLQAMSVSAHKVGGPAGIGALVVGRDAQLHPLLHGGGQQRGLRSGTQDVAGAAAFAAAAEAAAAERVTESARVASLRDRLVRGILTSVPGSELLGHPRRRLPGNAHVLFPGAPGETLLFLLDAAGIAVSTGSACQAGVLEPSHVVRALGRTVTEARQVLRFSLGHGTTAADVDAVLAMLPDAVARARAANTR